MNLHSINRDYGIWITATDEEIPIVSLSETHLQNIATWARRRSLRTILMRNTSKERLIMVINALEYIQEKYGQRAPEDPLILNSYVIETYKHYLNNMGPSG